MRKGRLSALLAALLLTLTACRAEEDDRVPLLREKYGKGISYAAAAEVELCGETEKRAYTLRFDADGEETRVTVLAPELLAGVTAHLAADTLALEYDGLVLDAGGVPDGVSAVNCVPLVLRAVGEGRLVEENGEEIDRGGETVRALRLCFETECGGEALRCAVWFDEEDVPLCAALIENEKITAYMEFTSFAFCDTMSTDESAPAQ